ncbi:MAG TPA: helix-turn-helix domain-containing protein [Chitinophagaceae bacterium]|nr:helix-turn-helix domain-containing protein [Chitinophagaceae bacterium]
MNETEFIKRFEVMEKNVAAIKSMLEQLLNNKPEKPQPANSEMMSVKQVAKFLALDINVVYAKCYNNEIPYLKIGRQYRFEKAEILKWMKEQPGGEGYSVDSFVDRYMQKKVLKF